MQNPFYFYSTVLPPKPQCDAVGALNGRKLVAEELSGRKETSFLAKMIKENFTEMGFIRLEKKAKQT